MTNHCFKSLCFVLIGFLCACRSDKPMNEVEPSFNLTTNGGVVVINEGNFTRGNATAGYYNTATGEVIDDLFEPINKRKLGDVFQSIEVFNGKAYLVLNNSGKIEVVNSASFSSLATIKGLFSPRYLLPVSNGKAYVSNYKTNAITIVDLNSNSITGSLSCGYGNLNEQMALSYGRAYVTTPASNKLYIINTRTDVLEDSIPVARGGRYIQEDANGKLWVLCAGKEATSELAGLYRIDPVSNKVEWSIQFPDKKHHPSHLHFNGDHTVMFYISKDGVFKLNITDTFLPASPIIPRGTMYLYGLGIDPKSGTVYVGDAAGFTSSGTVFRYQQDGKLINSFQSGVGPNGFYFN